MLLADQDRSLWDAEQIAQGATSLRARWRSTPTGRTRCRRRSPRCTPSTRDWPAIAALYGGLPALTGSPVVELNRAVALAESGEVEAALALVDGLDLDAYHYLHATRAELLRRLRPRATTRASAYERALELVHADAERALLQRRLAELEHAARGRCRTKLGRCARASSASGGGRSAARRRCARRWQAPLEADVAIVGAGYTGPVDRLLPQARAAVAAHRDRSRRSAAASARRDATAAG